MSNSTTFHVVLSEYELAALRHYASELLYDSSSPALTASIRQIVIARLVEDGLLTVENITRSLMQREHATDEKRRTPDVPAGIISANGQPGVLGEVVVNSFTLDDDAYDFKISERTPAEVEVAEALKVVQAKQVNSRGKGKGLKIPERSWLGTPSMTFKVWQFIAKQFVDSGRKEHRGSGPVARSLLITTNQADSALRSMRKAGWLTHDPSDSLWTLSPGAVNFLRREDNRLALIDAEVILEL